MESGRARHWIFAFTLALLFAVLFSGAAMPAQTPTSPGPVVDIQSAGGLAPDGGSISVQLLASCPQRWTVVEALVAVSQPQASGQASFTFPCISSLRMFTVVVPSTGGTFELGEALATASVTIKRGRTERAQDSQLVQVQPTVFVDLAATARLENGGEAVQIDVTVACPVGANGRLSAVNVSQGQTASGNGSYTPICDGQQHTFAVRVPASQGVYKVGDARALTFANVEHRGNSFTGVDDSPVQIVS
jgi:hypothetical protein